MTRFKNIYPNTPVAIVLSLDEALALVETTYVLNEAALADDNLYNRYKNMESGKPENADQLISSSNGCYLHTMSDQLSQMLLVKMLKQNGYSATKLYNTKADTPEDKYKILTNCPAGYMDRDYYPVGPYVE